MELIIRRMARLSADVTHNHPEGIKGAEATAAAIFMARTGSTKAEIKTYIKENFRYNLSRTCDEIRPSYRNGGFFGLLWRFLWHGNSAS